MKFIEDKLINRYDQKSRVKFIKKMKDAREISIQKSIYVLQERMHRGLNYYDDIRY